MDEGDAAFLEGEAQLRFRCAMEIVPAAFVITDGASRHSRPVGEIGLRPVKKPTGGATQGRCQNYVLCGLTHLTKLPILVNISHIWQFGFDC